MTPVSLLKLKARIRTAITRLCKVEDRLAAMEAEIKKLKEFKHGLCKDE